MVSLNSNRINHILSILYFPYQLFLICLLSLNATAVTPPTHAELSLLFKLTNYLNINVDEPSTTRATDMPKTTYYPIAPKMSAQFKYHHHHLDYQEEMELAMFRPEYDHGNGLSCHKGMVRAEDRYPIKPIDYTAIAPKTKDDYYITTALLINQ